MGMSEFYGAHDDEESIATIHRALDLGVYFLDTADMYGPFTNEVLVGKAIAGRRAEVVVATKFGNERRPRRKQDRHQRTAGIREKRLRGFAATSRRRRDRPLLPAPSRPRDADRRDCRCHEGAGRGGQGSAPRSVRSGAGDDPTRTRHPSDPALQTEYSLWSRDPR